MKFRRILLKLSGEVLAGPGGSGISFERIRSLAEELAELHGMGVQIGLVVGGGNLFRGGTVAKSGFDRVTGDHMGMLATVMNSLALQDALEKCEIPTRVMTAIRMDQVAEPFIRRRAIRHLEKGRIVLMAAGTGNPYFTTDTAGVLRAVEIGADVFLKGTKVDGVYDADPKTTPNANRYETLSYQDVLSQNLGVMDASAVSLSRENDLPIVVFDINKRGDLLRIVQGHTVGTVVGKG